MRVLITCPYSYNFRNIVLSGFLETLLSEGSYVKLLLPKELLANEKLIELQDKFKRHLDVGALYQSFSLMNKCIFLFLSSWKYKIQGTQTYKTKKLFLWNNDKILWLKYVGISILLPKSWSCYNLAENLAARMLCVPTSVKRAVRDFNPNVTIFTLLHKYNEAYYVRASKDYNVTTINLVHSWDVITTKGFFPLSCDKNVFWSTRNVFEYQKYIDSSLSSSNNYVVGPLQFDMYGNTTVSQLAVRKSLKLPLDKKIILYTTSVNRLVPDEEDFLLQIIDRVEKRDDLFLNVRIHPQATASEFSRITAKGKCHKIHRPEKSTNKLLDGVVFQKDTLDQLRNDLSSSDIVVNFASSMVLDAYAMNKPAIWIDLSSPENALHPDFYAYEHLTGAVADFGTPIVNSVDLLMDSIDGILDAPVIDLKKVYEEKYARVGSSITSLVDIIYSREPQ